MKKKRMVTALLTTAMVFGAVPTAFAADNITVTVDGQKVSFGDQQPVNINGRVMVPVRAVAEKMEIRDGEIGRTADSADK